MTDDRFDLSPLDPARDPVRWEQRVRAAGARGAAAFQRRRAPGLTAQLAAWLRPALACAAAAALLVGLPAWLRPSPTAPFQASAGAGGAAGADRASRLLAWAAGDDADPGGSLLLTLGGEDDAR